MGIGSAVVCDYFSSVTVFEAGGSCEGAVEVSV